MKALKRNLREQLVEFIGGDIVRGHFKPGDVLPNEEQLLTRYGVSRTVLRDAFNVLAGKGLIEGKPRRGTVVRPRGEWNQFDPSLLSWRRDHEAGGADTLFRVLDQLMEIRRIAEPAAAGLAARRAAAEDLDSIRAAYSAMEVAGNAVEPFMAADLDFHVACLHAAHNEFLLPIAHAIRSTMMQSLQLTNSDPERNRAVGLPLHRAILDAIVAGDAVAATTAMERHLNDTEFRQNHARRRLRAATP